jgi:TonB-linked SusC/RagA family outer membrane protein
VDVERKVDVDANDKTIDNILTDLFAQTDVHHQVKDRLIILTTEKTDFNGESITSQQNLISGKVTDRAGLPLPGVTIVVKGTTNGTVTNMDGEYSLGNIPDNATLQFSFVGMLTQEVVVGDQSAINVQMLEDAIGIEEVVAVGYGFKKKVNLTGSVASINSEVLKTMPPVASTTNALAGRLPGLISKQNSGSPGRDAASLSIRGFGDALVIVDGVESDFNNIDANEIESVSILKDASAAIYGARAGNGVILVTTKRGKDGKPTIIANSSYSLQSITAYPERMSSGQFAEYDYEKKMHLGAQQKFTLEDIAKYYAGTDPDYPNTNWRKELIRDFAPMQQHNISVSGGSDKIKYFGLIGFMDQETFWKNNGGNFQRYNIRSNIDAKITDDLSMQIDFSNINEMRKTSAREAGIDSPDLWHDYWSSYPIYPSSLPDPSKLPYTGVGGLGGAINSSNREILGFANNDSQDIKTAAALKYNFPIIEGLSARLYINYSQNYSNSKIMDKPGDFFTYNYKNDSYALIGTWSPEASIKQQNNKSRTITNQFSFNYDRVFDNDHTISALALYESIDFSSDYIQAQRYHFLTPAIEYLFAGSPKDQYAFGSANEMGRKSYIGRFNYSFKNKYLLEATFRADASAKFSSQKRWGYFPSLSAAWKISEESFLKNNLTWLESMKLRGGISNAGYDLVSNFAYLSGYQFGRNYLFSEGIKNGLTTTGLANPNLTWEKMTTYNLGLDYSLLKSKLYGELDIFYRKRNEIIANRLLSLPSTFGASLPPENLNSSNDRGFEAMAGTRGSKGYLSWDFSGNISWSRAKWDHFEEPDYSSDIEQARVYQKSGRWVDRVVGYKTDGLYTTQAEIDAMKFDQDLQGNKTIKPGDIKYIDLNNDGKLDWKDQTDLGSGSVPHWMFGLTTNLHYKSFDLSFLLQGGAGNYVSIPNPEMPNFQGDAETISLEMFNERWTEKNNDPNALFIRSGSLAQGGGFSDFYLKKAGYLRLKTFNVGYNLPKQIMKVAGITNLRIYFAGTNLMTIDPLKKYGLDPESPSNTFLYYPQQRTFTFGLNLTL